MAMKTLRVVAVVAAVLSAAAFAADAQWIKTNSIPTTPGLFEGQQRIEDSTGTIYTWRSGVWTTQPTVAPAQLQGVCVGPHKVAEWDGSGALSCIATPGGGGGGGGTVTSVGITGPSGITWSNSPVTGAATLTGSWTGPAPTAIALAANGANCPAGQAAAGVDASGAAEGCAAYVTGVTASAPLSSSGGATPNLTLGAVALGSGTTGNYVGSLATGSGLTGGAGGSPGAALTLSVPAAGIVNSMLASTYSGVGACGVNSWVNVLNGNVAPGCAQPGFSSLSGSPTTAQLGSGTASNTTFLRGDLTWAAPAGGGGGVTGPGSSTDRHVPAWNGSAGGALRDSGLIIDGNDAFVVKDGATAGLWFSQVAMAPYIMRSGLSLVVQSNDGSGQAGVNINAGFFQASDTSNATTLQDVRIRQGRVVAYSNGVDYARGMSAGSLGGMAVGNGASGDASGTLQAGTIALTKSSSALVACSASSEGASYYNSTSHQICVCNGTAYVLSPGGSPGVTTGC